MILNFWLNSLLFNMTFKIYLIKSYKFKSHSPVTSNVIFNVKFEKRMNSIHTFSLTDDSCVSL